MLARPALPRYHLAVGDSQYQTSGLVLDASPLIYLAKLEALDVLSTVTREALVTPAVLEEVTRPQVAYRHPDAAEIEASVTRGALKLLTLTVQEQENASGIAERIPGLDPGEAEVLAVSIARSLPAVIFERRARRVAGALGAGLIDVIELIVRGTTGRALRKERIVRFARMVDMRLDDAVELLARVGATSLG